MKLPAVAIAAAFAGSILRRFESGSPRKQKLIDVGVLERCGASNLQQFRRRRKALRTPAAELLNRLEASGQRILRTDRDGAVQISTDGRTVQVNCLRSCNNIHPGPLSAQTPDQHQTHQQQ